MRQFAIALLAASAYSLMVKDGDKDVMSMKGTIGMVTVGSGDTQKLNMRAMGMISMQGDYENEDEKVVPYAWICASYEAAPANYDCGEMRFEREERGGKYSLGVRFTTRKVKADSLKIKADTPKSVTSPDSYWVSLPSGKKSASSECEAQ